LGDVLVTDKKLVDLEDKILIRKILENLRSKKIRVKFWQTLDEAHLSNLARVEDVDLVENIVILKPIKNRTFFLGPSPYLYFYSHHRTTLFKTSIRHKDVVELEIKMPQHVKIHEGRGEVRHKLNLTNTSHAGIKLFGVGETLKAQVLDISENGAAIAIPRIVFEACDPGTIISVSSPELKYIDGKTAVVRNKAAYDSGPSNSHAIRYRLGLEFIPESQIEDFL
jgi:hypothetical protein